MKNNMVFIVSFFTLFTQAMGSENSFSITAYGTKISLHKGDMVRHYAYDKGTEDIVICTGRTQHAGKLGSLCCRYPLGKYCKMFGLSFSLHEDNSNQCKSLRCDAYDSNERAVYARKGIYLRCMEEPYLYKEDNGNFYYECHREGQCEGEWSRNEEYKGDDAVEEYLEDVSLCYKIVLNQEKLLTNDIKNIAISAFGVGFKYYSNFFAPKEKLSLCAVKSILEYIKSAPRAYNCIELFAEDPDFDLYKKVLIEYYELTAKICLFLFAQKDSESLLSVLPRDVMHYIAKLISHN